MSDKMLAVIGGSGLYEIDGLEGAAWREVSTPWGAPSDAILTGVLDGLPMAFLPRHGRGHVHSPTDVPYRANIDALKQLGATHVLSVSACGSFRDEMKPGDFVICDQFIDRTVNREKSFFSSGCVAHVSMAHPACRALGAAAARAAKAAGVTVHEGGCYLAMEGPQFSSLAESRMYREHWGCDVIGMTNMPEAKLAREAELPYATMAMVTDYDCWHDTAEAVSVANVLEIMQQNTGAAKAAIGHLASALSGVARTPSPQGIETCLDYALITSPDARDPNLLAKLDAVAGRVIG